MAWERSWLASAALIGCALLPAVSLLYARFQLDGSATSAVVQALFVVVPLSSFLLAVFLWKARSQISQLEAKQAEAAHQAAVDPLSTLPNRLLFDQLLGGAIAHCTHDAPVALISIDIDGFKSINDGHGHLAGDRLIVGIAQRLKRIVRDGDCLARVGGDEFALMVHPLDNAAQCAAMAHRILDAMIAPFDVGPAHVFVTASLGIALSPQDGDSLETLCQAADLALYRAKREGRNRFAFFDKAMEQKLQLGKIIEDDLRGAIMRDELTIAYQPLFSRCGTRMQGLEALVRWHHPKLGIVPPEEFIPLAESRGLVIPLGEWVLRRACQDARRWPELRMAVNVSPVQFRQRGFVGTVMAILESTGIDPSRLDLEMTEGVLIQDEDQAEATIIDLRALGIRMGLDDFGSGYSSMIYLRRFAFDKIKIDRAFLESMEANGEGGIILESIISLGHALGLTVTAEGVESFDQVEFLQKLGCDEMQGYYFDPPLSAEQIDERVSLQAWADQQPGPLAANLSAA